MQITIGTILFISLISDVSLSHDTRWRASFQKCLERELKSPWRSSGASNSRVGHEISGATKDRKVDKMLPIMRYHLLPQNDHVKKRRTCFEKCFETELRSLLRVIAASYSQKGHSKLKSTKDAMVDDMLSIIKYHLVLPSYEGQRRFFFGKWRPRRRPFSHPPHLPRPIFQFGAGVAAVLWKPNGSSAGFSAGFGGHGGYGQFGPTRGYVAIDPPTTTTQRPRPTVEYPILTLPPFPPITPKTTTSSIGFNGDDNGHTVGIDRSHSFKQYKRTFNNFATTQNPIDRRYGRYVDKWQVSNGHDKLNEYPIGHGSYPYWDNKLYDERTGPWSVGNNNNKNSYSGLPNNNNWYSGSPNNNNWYSRRSNNNNWYSRRSNNNNWYSRRSNNEDWYSGASVNNDNWNGGATDNGNYVPVNQVQTPMEKWDYDIDNSYYDFNQNKNEEFLDVHDQFYWGNDGQSEESSEDNHDFFCEPGDPDQHQFYWENSDGQRFIYPISR